MKRGDYAALLLFLLQAGFAFWYSRGIDAVVPALGDYYFQIPLQPLSQALSSVRTLGYPVFHALMAELGLGLPAYPEAQMLILIACVLIFWFGLRSYGLSGLAALAAVSPVFWIVPVALVIPETLAKCAAIASVGFVLRAAGRRGAFAYLGLALSVFIACQMRPAFLFLVVYVPFVWFFLYARRWGLGHQGLAVRHALKTVTACTLPLLLFCLLRLVVVGHFGLVSFGGQNTIGIAVEMLGENTASRLPVEDRPLAQLLARGRDAWPAPRYLNARGVQGDWYRAAETYAANINRTTRSLLSRIAVSDDESGNVAQDKILARVSTRIFALEWPMYTAWLVSAAGESVRVAVDLLFGGNGGGGPGFGFGRSFSLKLFIVLIAMLLLSWPLERRAFGEGSRPYFGRAAVVVLHVTGAFFLLSMLLVILVEPPIPRYVEAAAFLLPCIAAALLWDRGVVLIAGLCRRPWWYTQCLVAYPAVPDLAVTLPWRAGIRPLRPCRRAALGFAMTLVVLIVVVGWASRDNRLFRRLAQQPELVRARLMGDHPPVAWRADDGASVLHYAALHGDAALLAHLVDCGADTGALTRDGATALHWAAMGRGDAAVIARLADAGLDSDTPGPLGMTSMHLAALFGNLPALEAMIAHGANVNVVTTSGVAPLHVARSSAVADLLLTHGAAVDQRDRTQATPLMWAHTRALATRLLEGGADINAKENWWSFIRECTPLAKAAYQGDADTAHWLLQAGADPNAGDLNNLSPLYYAIWRKNYALAQLLIDRGADPNHPGHWAAYRREGESSRFTDIYLKTVGQHPAREEFARVVPDKAVMRPLDWAAFRGDIAAIELLLSGGAELGAHNEQGLSALHWAILGRQKRAVQWLRERDPGLSNLDDPRRPIAQFEAEQG